MSPFQVISIAFGLVMAAIVFVIQFGVTKQISGVMSEVVAGQAAFHQDMEDMRSAEMTVENAPGGALTIVKEAGARSPRDEILAVINPEVPARHRRVIVDVVIDPSAMLALGEALPEDEELRALTLKVRSRRISNALCEDMVARFASTCRAADERVAPIKDTRFYMLTTSLAYTPADAYGDIPDTEAVTYGERTIRPDRLQDVALTPGSAEPYLAQVYGLAEQACAAVRGAYGGCGTLRLSAELGRVKQDDNGNLTGSVALGVGLGWLEPALKVSAAQ